MSEVHGLGRAGLGVDAQGRVATQRLRAARPWRVGMCGPRSSTPSRPPGAWSWPRSVVEAIAMLAAPAAILGLCVRDLRFRMAIARPCSPLETCTSLARAAPLRFTLPLLRRPPAHPCPRAVPIPCLISPDRAAQRSPGAHAAPTPALGTAAAPGCLGGGRAASRAGVADVHGVRGPWGLACPACRPGSLVGR